MLKLAVVGETFPADETDIFILCRAPDIRDGDCDRNEPARERVSTDVASSWAIMDMLLGGKANTEDALLIRRLTF